MSERVKGGIARWVEDVDRHYEPVTVEELTRMLGRDLSPRVSASRRVPGPAIGLATLVIALLTVGGVALVRGLSEDGSPASPSFPSTSEGPAASTPDLPGTESDSATAAVLDTAGWSRVGVFQSSGGVIDLSSALADGRVLTAVGAETLMVSGSTVRVPAVWTSTDGLNWARVGSDEITFNSRQLSGGALHDVVGLGSRLIAAGSFDCEAAIWFSDDDGASWSRVPNEGAIFGPPGSDSSCAEGSLSIAHLVHAPGAVVAVDPGNQLVWSSGDGVTWRRISGDDPFGPGKAEIELVTAGGPGLVATGIGCDAPAGNVYYVSCRQTVWTSPDGALWTRSPDRGRVLGNADINDLAEAGPGLVAVGAVLDGDGNSASVWTSTDGIDWTKHDLSTEENTYSTTVLAVTESDDYLIAVGSGLYCSAAATGVTADAAWSCKLADGTDGVLRPFTPVWVSSDGLSWQRQAGMQSLPFFDAGSATELRDVLVIDDGLLAIGWGPDTSLPNSADNRFSSAFLWRIAK
ncbi:MAG: hypothetical protein R3258_05550 [Acidimicrobiia bacterium]|nr:hypothetical protein [Acidimicrobiia bacterium]